MEMPGLTYSASDYRYGFNSKEKDSAFGLLHYDYGFRIYHPGLGRFLSVDPRAAKYSGWSPYHYVLNNPILNIDPRGDTTRVYSLEGQLLETIEDSHPNEDHFMSQQTISLIEELGLNNGDANARVATYRELSAFFIGVNTRMDLADLSARGDLDGVEAYGIGIVDKESREVRIIDLSDQFQIDRNPRGGRPEENTRTPAGVSISGGKVWTILDIAKDKEFVLDAHSHGYYSEFFLARGEQNPVATAKSSYSLVHTGSPSKADKRGSTVAEFGNLNVGLIATPFGYTVYSTYPTSRPFVRSHFYDRFGNKQQGLKTEIDE